MFLSFGKRIWYLLQREVKGGGKLVRAGPCLGPYFLHHPYYSEPEPRCLRIRYRANRFLTLFRPGMCRSIQSSRLDTPALDLLLSSIVQASPSSCMLFHFSGFLLNAGAGGTHRASPSRPPLQTGKGRTPSHRLRPPSTCRVVRSASLPEARRAVSALCT